MFNKTLVQVQLDNVTLTVNKEEQKQIDVKLLELAQELQGCYVMQYKGEEKRIEWIEIQGNGNVIINTKEFTILVTAADVEVKKLEAKPIKLVVKKDAVVKILED